MVLTLPLVRSIDPVVVDPMTGRQAIVYFHCADFMINEKAIFKEQDGKVTFFLTMTELVEINETESEYRKIISFAQNPIAAEYKFSTFMGLLAPVLFSDSSIDGYNTRKAECMVQEIDHYSSQYMGLTANTLQIIDYGAED